MANNRQTGSKAASYAGKVLADKTSTKAERAAAASALSQTPKSKGMWFDVPGACHSGATQPVYTFGDTKMDGFKFDKRGIEKVVREAAEAKTRVLQKILNRVHAEYSGKPQAEVKVALESAWRRGGDKVSESQAAEWAALISKGDRVLLHLKIKKAS
ncbi:MAG: hypothetical protein ABI912_06300 [Actinomycetota bacterium]